MLEYVPFSLGLLCSAVVLVGFVATVVRPDYRFWPPGSDERKRRLYRLSRPSASGLDPEGEGRTLR